LKIHRLVAGTFVLFMVASMVFPAYASDIDRDALLVVQVVTPEEISSVVMPSSDADVIYQNGNNPDPTSGFFIDNVIIADDFVLVGGDIFDITDAHFTVALPVPPPLTVEPLGYFILEDDGNVPGNVISSGLAQKVEMMLLESVEDDIPRFEVWFDFEEGVTLDPGVTYWFALTYTPDLFDIESPEPSWELSDVVTGNPAMTASELPPTTWVLGPNLDVWFQLTGDIIIVDGVIGGEIIPIETASLLLASAQSFSWMIPVVLSGIGIGLFVVSRKSENS